MTSQTVNLSLSFEDLQRGLERALFDYCGQHSIKNWSLHDLSAFPLGDLPTALVVDKTPANFYSAASMSAVSGGKLSVAVPIHVYDDVLS